MNDDWRPNWECAELYPDPKDDSVSNERWAWEFLRRNPEYAEACERAVRAPKKGSSEWRNWMKEFLRLQRHYWVKELYPPNTPPGDVQFRSDLLLEMSEDDYSDDVRVNSKLETIIKFDFRFDLEGQLRWAEEQLKSIYEDLRKRGLIKKERINKKAYQRYLRILDGKHKKVSLTKLGKILCPNVGNPKDGAKELLAPALELSCRKYKELLYRP